MEFRILGPVEVVHDRRRVELGGPLERALLAALLIHAGQVVSTDRLIDGLWGEAAPDSAAVSVRVRVSRLRKALAAAGHEDAIRTRQPGYMLDLRDADTVDAACFAGSADAGRAALRAGDPDTAARELAAALALWRGPALSDVADSPLVRTEAARLEEERFAVLEDRIEAELALGRHATLVGELDSLVAKHPFRERLWAQRMLALYRCGRQGDALAAFQELRHLLTEELGIDPSPELCALESRILHQDGTLTPAIALLAPPPTPRALPSGVVTFLLTDIEGSTGLWERSQQAMAGALARHDELVAASVGAHNGHLIKSKGEGDATLSVFARTSDAIAAAMGVREAMTGEEWPAGADVRVRIALHTGEAHERDGDYFGPAVNRAARVRAIAAGGQIVLSRVTADLVRDQLPDTATLHSLGERELRGMSRSEHVFELLPVSGDGAAAEPEPAAALERPRLASVLSVRGPFVGRGTELDRLAAAWAAASEGTARALLIAGEPGVGKTRLAAEWARRVHADGALVLYGRCDEELGAPYQPFAEALHALAPVLGAQRLRTVRGVEQLVRLAPELADVLPGMSTAAQADADTERAILFDALARLLAAVSAELPLLLVVDDLHWAATPTLLLMRHLLRSGEGSRLQIVGTYRSTDLDRIHPLAGMLADLHRDGTTERIALGGLGADDVSAYLSAAGYDDARLGRALSSVTSGNPFFLIEVLRHLDESGGGWDPNTLPQGVREAVGRRLSRLSEPANEALLVGAVVGSRFSLELVERVLERDLIAPIEEARRAELVVEETGGRFRFNHALVRQSLLGEIASVRRVRLHQRIATALEADTAAADANLADLARHWFECAVAGGAAKAVDYSRRAGEQAMSRLAYEEAAVLYDQALQAADLEGSGCSVDDRGELLLARCEALLAAGDPTAAGAAVQQLQRVARSSARLSGWATCYAAQLAVLTHPERLDAIAAEVAAAARRFAELDDAEGEAKAHTVRATCLARLGRIGDCEAALDRALTAARHADNPRRVNAVLAGAPLAALWGPSPIARASGRCLDVVRVLRITTGSPAVEAVALRCQALLEALRGRTDAARRMLGSARHSLEALGHTHGLFETDVFAGMVELVAGAPADAEVPLRRAYDGLVARGVGVDAAQAAALLARAVLAQGRVDEAITLTEESERLAGVDLKAAIAWRSARAEALAQTGEIARALEAARAAVALADPTDALLDQADAHLSLGVVLRAGGQPGDAARETRRAAELYERKGATTRAGAVAASAVPGAGTPRAAAGAGAPCVRRNLATERLRGGPVDTQYIEDWAAELSPDFMAVDHRMHTTLDRDSLLATWRSMATAGNAVTESRPLASLGERHCMTRYTWRAGDETASGRHGPAEVTWINVLRVDSAGKIGRMESFGTEDLKEPIARLVEMHAEDELPPELRAGRLKVAAQARTGKPIWADDAILVDHRPVGLGTLHGREAMRAAAGALNDVGGDIQSRAVEMLGLDASTMLTAMDSEGRTEADEPFELPILWLTIWGTDGLLARAEWFAPEQREPALARFDELTSVGHAALPQRRVRPNRATERYAALSGSVDPQSVEERIAALSDRLVEIDHRTKVTGGREQMATTLRMFGAMRRVVIDAESLASLGERHALVRRTWHMEGVPAGRGDIDAADITALEIMRVDGAGLIARLERFDAGDLPGAVARLTELHADDELPLERHDERYLIARQLRDGDVAWKDDAEVIDHRPASLGRVRGREAIHGAGRALEELGAGFDRRIVDVLGASEHTYCGEALSEGQVEGSPVEMPVICVTQYDDHGRARCSEWYNPEQREEALARFDELTAAAPAVPLRRVRRNLATERLMTGRVDDRQIDAWSAELRRDVVGVDHRMHMSLDYTAMVASWRSMGTGNHAVQEATPLAALGERHGMTRFTWRAGDDDASARHGVAEVAWISVIRVDSDGKIARLEWFDPGDLRLALARLIELHAEDELPPSRRAARHLVASQVRTQDLRWTDDAVIVDRRPASLGTLRGAAAIRDAGHALRDLVADMNRHIVDVLGITERVLLVDTLSEGRVDGGSVEMPVLSVNEFGEDGRQLRSEWYNPEQREEALARFDELSAALPAVPLRRVRRNRATECLQGGRWDAQRFDTWISQIRADIAVIDHRMQLSMDHDAMVAAWRLVATDGSASIEVTPLASLGERHCLSRYTWRGGDDAISVRAGPAELSWLHVKRVDSAGKAVRIEDYDTGDLRLALARLIELHAEDELPPSRRKARHQVASQARTQEIHWSDDAVIVDHRPASLGTLHGAAAIQEASNALHDLITDLSRRTVDIFGLTERVLLMETFSLGNVDGGSVEIPVICIGEFDEDGRTLRAEWYTPEQLDDALARFDELAGSATAVPPTNEAVERHARLLEAQLAGDWEAVGAAIAEDALIDDRRAIVGLRVAGRPAVIDFLRSIYAVGVTRIEARPVATRGVTLALQRELISGSRGETEGLLVQEFDDSGLWRGAAAFDADDMDAAFDELDARYAAGEAAATAAAWALATGSATALRRRDWNALASFLGDDYVFVDHRALGIGRFVGDVDRDGQLALLQELVSLSPQAQLRLTSVLRLRDTGIVYRQEITGEGIGGGDFETTGLMLGVFRDGRIQRNEIFSDGDTDAVLRRFDELTAGQPALENGCTRLIEELDERLCEGDLEGALACRSVDSVIDDRRSLVGVVLSGDAIRETWRLLIDFSGGRRPLRATLATRGDRLALQAMTVRGSMGAAGAAEVSCLDIFETDASGHIVRETVFDEGDLAAAVNVLEEQYITQLSGSESAVWEAMRTVTACYNRRDNDGLRNVFAGDCVIVDERLTGWGTLDREAFLGHLGDLLGMAPDTVLMPIVVHTVTPQGSVASMRTSGTVPDGGDFEMLFECVSCVRDGKVVRLELLPEREVDQAQRRLSAASTGTPPPE